MLGARIAVELKTIDLVGKIDGQDTPSNPRKVIIHCSPYLRCIQTAIAISAGLRESDAPPRLPPALRDGFQLDAKIEEEKEEDEDEVPIPATNKALLRFDSFLEEWRSAGYFENTMPPAVPDILLAAAKEYTRKPAEEIKGADLSSPPIDELVACDWDDQMAGGPPTSASKTGLRQQMSKRARHLSDVPSHSRPIRLRPQMSGYNAPMPTYALAPSDKIPAGFVAHARDACIETDYDWDSSKTCGEGGTWDEEWSSMHRRVGNGLQELLRHYEGEKDEIVVILVTHQACCNALIRRITGAPALHDIGTASLTLAVRQDLPAAGPKSGPVPRKSLSGDISQGYQMKIIASTEHLRGGSNPLGLNSPRLGMSPAFTSRRLVGADSPEGFSLGDPWRPHPMNRSSSVHRSSETDLEPPIPEGLWGSGAPKRLSVTSAVDDGPEKQLWGDGERTLPVRTASQRAGMWGGGSITRDRSPGKRRWTAVDRSP